MPGWDPVTYLKLIREEIPQYDVLQAKLVEATSTTRPKSILELGIGSGETAVRVLDAHPSARLLGFDSSPAMLAAARERLPGDRTKLELRRVEEALPSGPFDLVISALTVHHLEGDAKARLFRRIAAVMTARARFVLADVVVPEDPAEATVPIEPGYDFPSSVSDQLKWLDNAGLDPAVFWLEGDLAVLTADARPESPQVNDR